MKKGFTLIELLAVIVILAVLALIATPIVLNIIDDSKKNATLRSSENYIKAIEFSIAKSVMENKRLSDGTYQVMSNGSICLGTLTGYTCSDTLVVEVAGETPESGTVTIKSRKIDSYEFTYASGFVVVNGEIGNGEVKQVCRLIDGEPNEIGSKYQCKVKEGLPSPYEEGYYFYVLSHEYDGTTNLIMERNICYDGTVATENNTCLVAWNETGDNGDGPVTAMNYLQEATKTWINTNKMVIDKFDNDNETKFDMSTYNTYARLPYYSEIDDASGKIWLIDYLDGDYENAEGIKVIEHEIKGIYGYWTLSSSADRSDYAWIVYYGGYERHDYIIYSVRHGVRPVINLKL